MLNMFELLLPLILIALISLPLVNVFRGKKSVSVAKRRIFHNREIRGRCGQYLLLSLL